jgi:hypothetical protein
MTSTRAGNLIGAAGDGSMYGDAARAASGTLIQNTPRQPTTVARRRCTAARARCRVPSCTDAAEHACSGPLREEIRRQGHRDRQ